MSVALAPTPADGILELKTLQSTFTKNFGWTQQSSKDSRLMTLCYATDAESKEEFYKKAMKPQLKEECSRRSLKVTGTKSQLIERLRNADAGIVEEESLDMPPPLSEDQIDALDTKVALQNALRSRGLKVSGKKEELRQRLKEDLRSFDRREVSGRVHGRPESAPEPVAAAEPEPERTVEPEPEDPDSGSEPEAAAEKAKAVKEKSEA